MNSAFRVTLLRCLGCRLLTHPISTRLQAGVRHCSVFGPEFDDEPDVPEYDTLKIQLQGYDFVTLESCAKYAHKLCRRMGLKADAYAVPARTSKVQTFKPGSSNILHEYQLAKYERSVQVEDLPSTSASLLIEAIQQNLPEGIEMTIKELDPEEEEFRYVPDNMLIELQQQVDALEKSREDRRRK